MTQTTSYRPATDPLQRPGRLLLVADHTESLHWLRTVLEDAGHVVEAATLGPEGLRALVRMAPDVVLADLDGTPASGFEFIQQLRSPPTMVTLPVICMTASTDPEDAAHLLALGADDCLTKPVHPSEIVARVRAKLDRPPVPTDHLLRHPGTGLLTEARFREELLREIGRSSRSGRRGAVAAIDLAERTSVAKRLGPRADQDLRVQVSALAAAGADEFDLLASDAEGRLLVLMPDADPAHAKQHLARLTEHVARGSFSAASEAVHVSPVVGFEVFDGTVTDPDVVIRRAVVASEASMTHLDLQPVRWERRLERVDPPAPKVPWTKRLRDRLRTPLQAFITVDLGVVLPFLVYVLLDRAGFSIAPAVYVIVVVALLFTATLIWVEGFLALDPGRPPEERPGPFPPASALIAAYLPNEAATVVQTVEAMLRTEYPGPVQVILAYNTPHPLPVEQVLHQIAERDSRFVPYRVIGSTSKAQNVNAALGLVTGEFVGVFDADHQPAPDSFRRAWRWLAKDYDVVQGHCVVRNGETSAVARTVAVEFESIYAVSHPGRARLHDFGIFGGSNGYWRTDLLRRVRMQGSMLTEDIDSSMRVLEAGGRIASDPALVSRELAPTTVRALWNQRMRWAQGWFQVSRKHMMLGWRSDLTLRQKLGITVLLGWREVYPWLSLQILPLLAFFAWKAGGVGDLNLLIPFFVLTTLFTLSVGPGQTYFAYRLAAPEVRRHQIWFLAYLVVSTLIYTEMKNMIGRIAQIKELTGDRQWRVTPRSLIVDLRTPDSDPQGAVDDPPGDQTSPQAAAG